MEKKKSRNNLRNNFLVTSSRKDFFFASPKHSTPVEKCRNQGSNNRGPLRWCKPGLQDCTRAVSLQFHPDSWSSGSQKVPGHFLHSYPQVGYGLILSLHEAVKTTNHVGILSSGLARTLRTTVAFRAALISLVPAFFQNLARSSCLPISRVQCFYEICFLFTFFVFFFSLFHSSSPPLIRLSVCWL